MFSYKINFSSSIFFQLNAITTQEIKLSKYSPNILTSIVLFRQSGAKYVKHPKSFVLYIIEVLALILGTRSAVLRSNSMMSTNFLVCDNSSFGGPLAGLEQP